MTTSLRKYHLESDGSLVVDLADERGPVLKFGSLAEGMPWARVEGGQWVATDYDYDVLLVNDAHESRNDLPVQRYLASIPKADIEVLNRLRHVQATVLQLYARWAEARDLLRSNPVLLWLVADRYANEVRERHRVPEMLLKSQKELLEWVIGLSVRPAQIRFLTKLVVQAGDHRVLERVRLVLRQPSPGRFDWQRKVTVLEATERMLREPGTVARLRHWTKVPAGFLGLLLEAPVVAELRWLRDEVAATTNVYDVAGVVEQRRRLLRDTVRMLTIMSTASKGEPIDLRRCRSAKSVQALHDRLMTAATQLGWQELIAADMAPTQAFPAPPIPSDERFAAITNVAELVQEAMRMKHCVVTRAADAMAGACALYCVNVAGQRATLEVALGRHGKPLSIDEFRLACNAEPSEAAWVEAREWFERGQREWRGRGER